MLSLEDARQLVIAKAKTETPRAPSFCPSPTPSAMSSPRKTFQSRISSLRSFHPRWLRRPREGSAARGQPPLRRRDKSRDSVPKPPPVGPCGPSSSARQFHLAGAVVMIELTHRENETVAFGGSAEPEPLVPRGGERVPAIWRFRPACGSVLQNWPLPRHSAPPPCAATRNRAWPSFLPAMKSCPSPKRPADFTSATAIRFHSLHKSTWRAANRFRW